MVHIYYNPWSEEHKQPFGAVATETKVDFWLSISEFKAATVTLVMRKEGEAAQELIMNRVKIDQFHYEFTTASGAGLYFYYFKIDCVDEMQQPQLKYYGFAGNGGAGQVYSESPFPEYQLTVFEKAEVAPAWYQKAVFYQIFPDRFFNGNPTGEISGPKKNTFIYGTTEDLPMYIRDADNGIARWDFYGGNLKGIKEKLPYLKKLGITALYLNPIFEACSNHRYDTSDYFKIDRMLGSEAEFKELLDTLHAAGIAVILDGVFSHVGRNSRYFNQAGLYGETNGASRNRESRYYPWFTFENYPDEYKSWWGVADLPEVNKENPSFQEFIYGEDGVIDKWTRLGVDGWRLDVADELTDEFIAGIRDRLNHYPDKILIGEVWEDASNKIAYDKRRNYLLGDHLQSVMNYPLREQIIDILQNKRSYQTIAEEMVGIQENYPHDFYYNQLNNIGTHDTKRILTALGENKKAVTQAWGLLFMMPGIPCLYYGDEAGLSGDVDPDNRRFFPWQKLDQELFEAAQNWTALRKNHPALQTGEFYPFYSEDQALFGIFRYDEKEYTVFIYNGSSAAQKISLATLKSPRSFDGNHDICSRMLEGKVINAKENLFLIESL